MNRFTVGMCGDPAGGPVTFGINDWQPPPGRRPTAPGRLLICRTAIREYTPQEATQVVDWLNGVDQPLVTMVAPEQDPWMVRWEKRVGVRHLLD